MSTKTTDLERAASRGSRPRTAASSQSGFAALEILAVAAVMSGMIGWSGAHSVVIKQALDIAAHAAVARPSERVDVPPVVERDEEASITSLHRSSDIRNRVDGPSAADQLLAEEQRIVAQLGGASLEAQAAIYLGPPRFGGFNKSGRVADRVSNLLADPALRNLGQLDDGWLVGIRSQDPEAAHLFGDKREFVQAKVLITRNLHFQDLPMTREAVRAEYQRIREARAAYSSTRLFAERNVVFAATYERLAGSDESMFGRSVTRRQLERQGTGLAFFQPSNPKQPRFRYAELKNELAATEPVTFFFEGHGRSGALKLGGALEVDDLAGLLSDAPADASRIVISATCRAHDYMRRVVRQLQQWDSKRPLPIFITPEEYGQDFAIEVYHDNFKRQELLLGLGTVTIGSMIEAAGIGTSIYVPDAANRPMQIL